MSTPLLHRQVLAAIGGWSIAWCLTYPDVGVPHLRSSCAGGTALTTTRFAASWPDGSGYACGPKGIAVGPDVMVGADPWAFITWREVTAVCTGIDRLDLAELIAEHRAAQRIAADRHALVLPLKATPAQRAEHAQALAPLLTRARRQRERSTALIYRALEVDGTAASAEPADLLELLAMAGAS